MRTKFQWMGPIFCAAAVALLCAPAAAPDVWNKKTIVSFPEPVELPGRVTLPTGSYVMKLLDSPSNRHIVQVLNRDENRVFATILAIPAQRMEPAEKTIITFYETPSGNPSFIRNWFYPGDTIGQEFAYPKDRAMYIARAARTNVPIAPAEPDSPVSSAVNPEDKETGISGAEDGAPFEAADDAAPAPDQPASPEQASKTQQPSSEQTKPKLQALPEAQPVEEAEKLPATASMAPYLALGGVLFVSAAFLIKGVRGRGRRWWRHPSW